MAQQWPSLWAKDCRCLDLILVSCDSHDCTSKMLRREEWWEQKYGGAGERIQKSSFKNLSSFPVYPLLDRKYFLVSFHLVTHSRYFSVAIPLFYLPLLSFSLSYLYICFFYFRSSFSSASFCAYSFPKHFFSECISSVFSAFLSISLALPPSPPAGSHISSASLPFPPSASPLSDLSNSFFFPSSLCLFFHSSNTFFPTSTFFWSSWLCFSSHVPWLSEVFCGLGELISFYQRMLDTRIQFLCDFSGSFRLCPEWGLTDLASTDSVLVLMT